MTTLALAIVQRAPVFLNLAASLDRAEALIREASGDGAEIVVFPEAWLPGYPVWLDEAPGAALWGHSPAEKLFALLHANCPTLDGREMARLAGLAAELGVEIVIGIQERRAASLYNSVVRLTPEGRRDVHRKIMPTHNERLIWPAVTELHLLASRHYAFEGQCYVAAAGTVLTRDDVLEGLDSLVDVALEARELLVTIPVERTLLKTGGSAIVSPDASVIAIAAPGDPQTLHATIDLARLAEGRLYLDTAGHYARPDIFDLAVDTRARPGVRRLT